MKEFVMLKTRLLFNRNDVAKMLFGQTKDEAQKKNICISCKKPINVDFSLDFESSSQGDIYSKQGYKEYQISGMCEHCFDKTTL